MFEAVEPGVSVDWAMDVFPALMAAGAPVYGHVAEGYWEDVGTQASYLKAHADVLQGRVDIEVPGFEVAPGIWVGDGAEIDPDALLTGPVCVGENAKVEGGAFSASCRCSAATSS